MTGTARLYGRLNGHGSQAQVTRGFLGALSDAGALAGVVALDRDPPPDAPLPPGAAAKHAAFTGPHALMARMQHMAHHERRWVMLAPNSDSLPADLVRSIEECATDVMVPSRWAARVAREHTELPVSVVPHGVDDHFRVYEEPQELLRGAYNEGLFIAVHFSTSERQRKGTRQLVEAWEELCDERVLPERAELRLVLDYDAMGSFYRWAAERGRKPPQIVLVPRTDSSPEEMARGLNGCHLVCQPSRGEGFGMVPLEARACGTPVLATYCTGHSQHLQVGTPGFVAVAAGELEPIDDMPGALAPAVSVQAVSEALTVAYQSWGAFKAAALENATAVQAEWSWRAQLAPWIATL